MAKGTTINKVASASGKVHAPHVFVPKAKGGAAGSGVRLLPSMKGGNKSC